MTFGPIYMAFFNFWQDFEPTKRRFFKEILEGSSGSLMAFLDTFFEVLSANKRRFFKNTFRWSSGSIKNPFFKDFFRRIILDIFFTGLLAQ